MPRNPVRAMPFANHDAVRDQSGVPMSDWLRTAVLESVRRDTLLAAEDAIMLVDILEILSRKAMPVEKIISNPLIGGWLRQAIGQNLRRPLEDALRDSVFLRDMSVINLMRYYQSGQLSGPDADIRVCNVVAMTGGVGVDIVAKWSREAAAHLRALAEAADGGLSEIRDRVESESAAQHVEMAEIIDQLSGLSASELRDQLLTISNTLFAQKDQIQ